MKKWFSNNLVYIAGGLAGAVAGYIYWQQVGCANGTCTITSRPLNSIIYGAVLGTLIFGLFKKQPKKEEKS